MLRGMDKLTSLEEMEAMLQGCDPEQRRAMIFGALADTRAELDRLYARREAILEYAERFLARASD
jgi:hypothetical protein